MSGLPPGLQAIPGIAILLCFAWLVSEDRRGVPWRPVGFGLGLAVVLAALFVRFPPAARVFTVLEQAVDALQRATDTGAQFVFGYLAGGPPPYAPTDPAAGFVLAFKVLPLVLVISALSALLFHWGVLQLLARGFAWLLRRSLGIGGALAIGAAVHVFVGMTEAPLLIRPYLSRLSRGEMFALMSCGMAGIAGTVMAVYAALLDPVVPGALGNILAASIIATPTALAVAAVMIPFGPGEDAVVLEDDRAQGPLDALMRGTMDGLMPMVSIAAVLIVAIALVALVNMALGLVTLPGGEPLTLQMIFAWPFRIVTWLIGIPWAETPVAAGLMATKTVLNEFVAYVDLAHLPPGALSPHARLVMTYALCGFANFGSVGILVGGIGAMVPERRAEVVGLGARSLVSGTIATCISGALAGLFEG